MARTARTFSWIRRQGVSDGAGWRSFRALDPNRPTSVSGPTLGLDELLERAIGKVDVLEIEKARKSEFDGTQERLSAS